jgi:hypothetical protein
MGAAWERHAMCESALIPMLWSEVQLPGVTEDEAMIPIEVVRVHLYFSHIRNYVQSVQDSQKEINLMQQVETGRVYNCVGAD